MDPLVTDKIKTPMNNTNTRLLLYGLVWLVDIGNVGGNGGNRKFRKHKKITTKGAGNKLG